MEESEVCSLPGGLASVRKQFETQETASSLNVTQFHFHHRSVQVHMSYTEDAFIRLRAWKKWLWSCDGNIFFIYFFVQQSMFLFAALHLAVSFARKVCPFKLNINTDCFITSYCTKNREKSVGLGCRHYLTFLSAFMKTSKVLSPHVQCCSIQLLETLTKQ